MEPRTVYTTLTPDAVTFPPQESGVAEQITFIPPPEVGLAIKQPTSMQDRTLELLRENKGLLLIGAAQFFGPCMNISVQMLNRLDPPVPPTEMLFVRQAFLNLLQAEVRLLLVIRGVCGFCGVFGMYYSLQYLSLSDSTVLTFLSPFFTSFSGTFFLGETFSQRNFFAGICSLVGVVLIARPEALFGPLEPVHGGSPDSAEGGTPRQRLLAVAVSMIGVFGASGAYTSLRAIGKRAHTLHSMTYFSLFSGMISAILMLIGQTKFVLPTDWRWGVLMVSISVFGFMAQLLLIMGLQMETASRGSLAMYIQIVFASILERMFFHATPSIFSMSGNVIILSSAIYVALTKRTLKDDQPRLQANPERRLWEVESSSASNDVARERLWDIQRHPIRQPEETIAHLEEGEASPQVQSSGLR